MAKTELTRKIEASLSSWSTTKLGGVKLNAMRKGFCAIEVPVECGSVKGGLVDFIRVDECLLNEREAGGCSFAAYRQCDEKGYAATVKEFADELAIDAKKDHCRHCDEGGGCAGNGGNGFPAWSVHMDVKRNGHRGHHDRMLLGQHCSHIAQQRQPIPRHPAA